MSYSDTKFEVATSNGLGGDTFTSNVKDGQTEGGMTDRLWYEINSGYKNQKKCKKKLIAGIKIRKKVR